MILAAARVLFGAAALPLFNNVDEQMHYDLVRKYARGHVPARIERMDPDAVLDIAEFGSPEYFNAPEAFADGREPEPLWERPSAQAQAVFANRVAAWAARINLESNHPPVYYALAAAWYRIGVALGLSDGSAVFWIRFLNALFAAALVWLSRRFGVAVAPNDALIGWGLPLLSAVMPQDIMYGMNNDVLSSLAGAAALYAAWRSRAEPGPRAVLDAGLLSAVASLVKWTNLALLPGILYLAWSGEAPSRRAKARRVAVCAAGCAIFLAPWFLWKFLSMGQLTGESQKAALMGWTLRPVEQWLTHPLFTLRGAFFFLRSFLETFWRGELIWHGRRLFAGPWDWGFVAISCVGITAALWELGSQRDRNIKTAAYASLHCLRAYLAGLAWITVRFDFGATAYPSRQEPFLYSGRLALGMLVPFLFLCLLGLKRVTPRLGAKGRLWIVGALGASLLALDLAVLSRTVGSRYNWFHLPNARDQRHPG